MGRAGHLPLRPNPGPGRRLLHRHPPTHGVGLAARGPHLQLHPHRHRGPLPAHAGPGRLLPHGLGRQRPAHRATGRELLRGPLRPVGPLRGGLPAPRPAGQEAPGLRRHQSSQLRRAVRGAHRHRRAGLRGPVPPGRAVGRLVAHLHHRLRSHPAHQPAGVPAQPGPGRGLLPGGAEPVGHHVPDRGGPGRAGGPRPPRRLPRPGLPPHRWWRRRGHLRSSVSRSRCGPTSWPSPTRAPASP